MAEWKCCSKCLFLLYIRLLHSTSSFIRIVEQQDRKLQAHMLLHLILTWPFRMQNQNHGKKNGNQV